MISFERASRHLVSPSTGSLSDRVREFILASSYLTFYYAEITEKENLGTADFRIYDVGGSVGLQFRYQNIFKSNQLPNSM
jgi:hypothetical protein